MAQLLLLFALLATAWLFVFVPQQRRVRGHRQFVADLSPGDQVVTTAGVFGTVRAVHDTTVDLEIAHGIVITIARMAIGRMQADLVSPDADPLPADDPAGIDADLSE